MASDQGGEALSFHEFEQAGWAQAAIVDGYDAGFGKLTTQVVPSLLDAAGVGSGTRVLDVACGPAYAAGAALQRGATVTGVDFSSAMVERAALRYPEVDFRTGDAHNLNFRAGSFDAVVINFGLMHFERPEQALLEAFRVLSPGGKVAFTVWATPDKVRAVGLMQEAVQAHGNLDVSLPPGTPFFRFSEHAECLKVLEEAGFRQCSVTEVGQTWEFQSADEVLHALEEGTVRNRALLQAQSPERMMRIREAFQASLQAYRGSDGVLRIPMPAVLASGSKP